MFVMNEHEVHCFSLCFYYTETCGPANHRLQFDESLTILGGYNFTPEGTYTAYFAIYSGTSESIPNTTTNSTFIEHPNSNLQIECIWKLTEPSGSRIRVEVLEFAGVGVKLKIGNGADPSNGIVNAVLTTDGFSFVSIEVLSVDSGVWITLEFSELYGYLTRLRIVSTVYNITGKLLSFSVPL